MAAWPKRMMPAIRLMAVAIAVLLAGCRVDAIVPVNLSDVRKAITSNEPAEVTVRLLLTFTSRAWCDDMGASLVMSLRGSGLNMMPVSCTQEQGSAKWHGELRMPIRLDPLPGEKAAEGDGAFASLAVKPDRDDGGALSVTAYLDAPRLKSAQASLLEFPAAQENADARIFDLSVTFMVKNDLAEVAALKFDAMTTEIDTALAMPAGAVRSITLSPLGVEKLLQEQSVQVFSMTAPAK